MGVTGAACETLLSPAEYKLSLLPGGINLYHGRDFQINDLGHATMSDLCTMGREGRIVSAHVVLDLP